MAKRALKDYEKAILSEIRKLPLEAQREVFDFVRFLNSQRKLRLGEVLDEVRKEFASAGYTSRDINEAVKAVRRRWSS